MEELVVLVNEGDQEVGVGEKLRVHAEGSLHRAVSVFLVNDAGALLLQRRHPSKYHSGGLWSNTCCGHPRPREPAAAAAVRRLREEMGVTCPLERAFGFVYEADLGGLREHEYDHVFVGSWEGRPRPDPEEVADWRWVEAEALRADIAARPERYTVWFRQLLGPVLAWLAPTLPRPSGRS